MLLLLQFSLEIIITLYLYLALGQDNKLFFFNDSICGSEVEFGLILRHIPEITFLVKTLI